MGGDIIIRSVELEDIPGILEVQKDLLLKNKTIVSAKKEGFLVYPIKEEELEEIILSESVFLIVAEDKRDIVGYILAYDLEDWRKIKPKWDKRILVIPKVKDHLNKDKIIYFRHVARKFSYAGVGFKLEENIYLLAKNKGFKWAIGEILERPLINEESKKAHEERGYIKIGQADYLDGNFWGLYEKELK